MILPPEPVAKPPDPDFAVPEFTDAQRAAAETLRASVAKGGFGVTLIDGVTGSGKTESIQSGRGDRAAQGRQVLVMMPEIALTAQFLNRFAERFGVPPAEWHSQLAPRKRALTWTAVPAGTAALCAAIAGCCAERLVAVGRTDAAQPAAQVLVIDDYELVAGSAHPLLPYLPHARDIGLRVVLARSCGGLARARYEPVLQAFGDVGAPLLLLSGDPAEGRLQYGMTPRPLPPGRGRLGRRGRPELTIQTPWTDP